MAAQSVNTGEFLDLCKFGNFIIGGMARRAWRGPSGGVYRYPAIPTAIHRLHTCTPDSGMMNGMHVTSPSTYS